MMRSGSMAVAAGLTGLLWIVPGSARAETVCGTIADFNDAMAATAGYVEEVTVEYDVVGVNPADFPETKGSLGQLRYGGCALGGQDAGIKVYGTSDPLNEAHPPGTLKMEYGNACCAGGDCGEGWADPNASEVIFVDGTEACHVKMWMDPLTYGYQLTCNGVVYDAVGDNTYANKVDQIAILEYILDEGGTTWEIENATASNDEACWVTIPTGMDTLTVPVVQDVTAAPAMPDTVFADPTDLAVEAADAEVYLQFQVPPIEGKVTSATLFLHTRPESFAEGDGGEVHVVSAQDWSEASLTWNTRPAYDAASLGRIGPAASDVWVSLDVDPAIAEAGALSLAIVSPPTDGNGTHFQSKEAAADQAPYLVMKYVVVDLDGDGSPDGPDCDDGDAAVNPGVTESCNGIDDDCDGDVDEGCAGAEGDGTAGEGDDGGDGGSGSGGADDGSGGELTLGGSAATFGGRGDDPAGCACSTEGPTRGVPLSVLMLVPVLVPGLRRRRRRRRVAAA